MEIVVDWEAQKQERAKMPEKIAAIPTMYAGVQFRSRLEAKWAAFFDLCGWRWQYEPGHELNGWIPDFSLNGLVDPVDASAQLPRTCEAIRDVEEILVEVKPFSRFEEFDTSKIHNAIKGTRWEDREILLLGAELPPPEQNHDGVSIGWMCQVVCGERSYGLARATEYAQEKVGFCHEYQGFFDRISGLYAGGTTGSTCRDQKTFSRMVIDRWRAAGNPVQWNPPRKDQSRA